MVSNEEVKSKAKENQNEKVARQLTIDLWRTRFHGEKIGIRQDAQHRQDKGFQWSKDMEPLGEVKENGEKTRLIGIRGNLWDPEEGDSHNPEFEHRLVLKSFTQNSWVGSFEELNAIGLKNSAAVGKKLPVFLSIISDADYTILLEQMRTIFGRTFSFMIETGKRKFELMWLRERRFTLGSDWDVRTASSNGKKVADIDGKFLNMGGAWDIKIFDPNLAKNNAFVETLLFFAATLRFQKEIRKKIGHTLKAVANNQYQLNLEPQEYNLLKNPRIRRI